MMTYATLVVPLKPRSQGALFKTTKLLLQKMRGVDDSMGEAMRNITLSGIQINQETNLSEGLIIHVPLPVFGYVSSVMDILSDRISGKGTKSVLNTQQP